MRTRILFALCVSLLAAPAFAQGRNAEPKLEVSGGYSYALGQVWNAQGSDHLPVGWDASMVLFVGEGVGFNVDIAGHYGSQYFGTNVGDIDASSYSYLAGVKMVQPIARFEVTARLLGGVVSSTSIPGGFSQRNTGVALGFGGGVDVPMGRFGVRAVQVDVLLSSALREVTPVVSAGLFYRWH